MERKQWLSEEEGVLFCVLRWQICKLIVSEGMWDRRGDNEWSEVAGAQGKPSLMRESAVRRLRWEDCRIQFSPEVSQLL